MGLFPQPTQIFFKGFLVTQRGNFHPSKVFPGHNFSYSDRVFFFPFRGGLFFGKFGTGFGGGGFFFFPKK